MTLGMENQGTAVVLMSAMVHWAIDGFVEVRGRSIANAQ
jgi:hypothetical protein